MAEDEFQSWLQCTILTEVFKTVDGHQLKTDIVFPPSLKPGLHPLIIAYHGGGLVVGSRNFYRFMAKWLPDYAASTNAIIVSPDHRLLPSASGGDMIEDFEDLWKWVHSSLPAVLEKQAPEHKVDLSRILLEGGSAGGFCVGHLALSHPTEVKAVIMVYPMLDAYNDYYVVPRPPGETVWRRPESELWRGEVLKEKIAAAISKGWVSDRSDPEGFKLVGSILSDGVLTDYFGTEKGYSPLERVKLGKGRVELPPKTWILQGGDDTAVPAQHAVIFAEEVKKAGLQTELKLDIIDGCEHGFDSSWTMQDKRLTDRLDWISEAWL